MGGGKNINHEVGSKFIRVGLVSLLNLGSTLGPGKVLFHFCRGYMCSFAEAICISQRLYAFFRRGYMHFAEAIFSFAEAICSKIANNNHLSPVDTEAGTELGKKSKCFTTKF